jgi:Response regulator containing CheY-like receiver domain and AraC-type DNA-binding domain
MNFIMLKVLLIDDEPIVREGLKTIIEWENNGFFICEEGIDGKDGLNKILQIRPDLVLIDIKMPGLNGIEVIKEAREQNFNGKFIILTGYSDFAYAKSAIKYDVSSYLLKPIDEDELLQIVKNLYSKICSEIKINKLIDDNIKISKNNLIKELMLGKENVHGLTEQLKDYNLNYEYDKFQVGLINFQQSSIVIPKELKLEAYVKNMLQDERDIDVFIIDDTIGILIKGKENLFSRNLINYLTVKLSKDYGEFNILAAVGRIVSNLEDIKLSYYDAKGVVDRRFLYEEMNVVFFDEIYENNRELTLESINIENIYTFIEVGDIEKINNYLNEIEIMIRESSLNSEKIRSIAINCFIEIKEKIVLNYSEYKNKIISNEGFIRKIYDARTLKNLISCLSNEFMNISKVICNTNSENTIKRILNYIDKNYSKDIKLETLAEIFNYNSSYLGKLFKTYTGENFNIYLDKIRIENAKNYLQNDLKVYQVSEKVGYKNIDYFYSKFKKYVGVSPKEYKNKKVTM